MVCPRERERESMEGVTRSMKAWKVISVPSTYMGPRG